MVEHELVFPATMHKTENSKLNLQGKLRLKMSNSDSTQGISNSDGKINFDYEARQQTIYGNNQSCHKENFKSVDDEDDSLADFKSPKQETVRNSILNKFKVDAGKMKKKVATSKAKLAVKSRRSNANQPSIEASLLKPQTSNQNQTDIKEAFPCPVCLKPFKDDTTCTAHMKSCAAKNNVSIKQLLEAKRLQDRQAQERKAIGLLAAPIIPEKKKAFRSRNFSTGDDPQLQLVLAMSKSLYEAEKIVELEEAAFLAGIPSECITEMNEEERKKTLQSFGFTTNKPMADIPTNKQRRKKILAPTVLQTRSREDKDRVLTERIACILTGEDALTQAQEKTTISLEHGAPRPIISRLLMRIEKRDDKLWDKSRLTRPLHDFYVNELKSHFVKSTSRQPVESSETYEELLGDCEKQDAQTLNTSLLYEPMDLDIISNNQEAERDTSNCEIFNMNELERDNFESEFVQNFINGWKEALNDSSASDLVVLVKNNKRIYAHKLVFHIQCPNILLDIEPLEAVFESPIQQKISWLDKEEDSALAFLEFIYSGTIHKYISIFYHKELVHQVEQLARLYRKQDLFTYVRKKRQEISFQRDSDEQEEGGEKSLLSEMQDTQKNSHVNKLVTKSLISDTDLMTKQEMDRRITASPDLFDSEEDEAKSSSAIKNNHIKEEIHDVQDSADESDHLNSQKTLVNLSRSVSPLENIHEAITPPSGRSPKGLEENQLFNEQQIAQAVTPPKCPSPEKKVDVKQEVIESLANAVTPEYMSELDDHITPKKLVYADMMMAQDDIDESIYTAVTPPRLQEQSGQMTNQNNVHKIKSELTMFIEKVQRRNAKDIMDTDSETDSPDSRRKNPFLKRDQDDSYKYLRNNRDKKHHKAISLLEKDLLNEQKVQKHFENVEINFNGSIQNSLECLRNDNPSTSKLEQVPSCNSSTYHSQNIKEDVSLSDDQVEDITVEETEMSMYTKYKKSNKCDNSIAHYREQLDFDGQKICTNDKARSKSIAEEDSNDSKTSRSTVSQSATVKKPKPRIIEDVTLVSDSDEEESPLRTFLRDKSKKKIYRSSPVTADMNNKDSNIDTATPASNIENDSKFPLELVTEPLEPREDSNVFNSKNRMIDLSVDSDDGGIHDESSSPRSHLLAQSDGSLKRPRAFITEFGTSIDKRKELEKAEDIDAEISRILQSSQEIIHVHENSSDPGKVDKTEEFNENRNANIRALGSERQIVDLSPISIASSPEPCELHKINSQRSENNNLNDTKCSQNSEGSLVSGGIGDYDALASSDWNVKTPPKETVRSIKTPAEESSRARSSVKKLNYDNDPWNSAESGSIKALSNLNNQTTLISSPILHQNRRSSGEIQEKYSKFSNKMKNKPEDTRKLKVKAASMSSSAGRSAGETDRSSLQRCSSFVTPEQYKSSNGDHKDEETRPLDYSLLDTPNLQKELRKFGLKPQSRTRAKALLTHIYKETQSQPSAAQKRTSDTGSSSDEADEPPAKRQYVKSVTKTRHATRTDKNCSVIAEEMDFDEPDVASISQNPVSIKDAFFKLIKTNRELYNKVLTYEPLALETLHSMLKQNGFKCQLNSLMIFLDEQCITFQVKANKGDRIKK